MHLLRDGKYVGLRYQAAQTLRILLERSGMVVPYEELAGLAWGETDPARVDRRKIHVTIHELKGVLADYARCIETVKKRGYRFNHPRLDGATLPEKPRARLCLVLMPFEDLTRERDKADLAAGMMLELATTLTKLEHLQIIRGLRHTARFLPPQQPGESRYLVEGSIAGQNTVLKIHIGLLKESDNTLAWSDTFPTSVAELPGVQARIAAEVAQAVKVKTNNEEMKRMSVSRTVDGEAYLLR